MDEGLSALIAALKGGWTPGAVGIWTLGPVIIAILAKGLWRELPAWLEAWTRRSDAESERTRKEFERLEGQIAASDRRHAECEERCDQTRREVERLNKIIDGLIRQFRQLQISAVRVGMDEPPSVAATLIAELDRIPSSKPGDKL